MHTPGPWNHATAFSSICGIPICARSGKVICNVQGVPKDFPNSEAINAEAFENARVLSAAPDLLNAAELAEAVLAIGATGPGIERDVLPKLRAAIAAAREVA